MSQIPHANPGLVCPLHRKDVSKVCHKCPFWAKMNGTNPNTGEPVDTWQCAISWLPWLLVENARQTVGAAAATESMRNEILKRMDATMPIRMLE
jgi:hypothetical protein